MTNGIAHEMHQRIHHPLYEKLIDLRLAATELHNYLLAAFTRQITHHERHALEDFADLDHAHAYDTLAQVAQLLSHAQACFLKRTPLCGRRDSFQLHNLIVKTRATDHELADDAHQLIKPLEINPHNACRRDRSHWLAVFRTRRRFNRSRLERQTISFEICKRCLASIGGDNKLERDLAGAFDDRLRLDQLSNLLQPRAHAVHVHAALGEFCIWRKLDLP